MDKYAVEPPEFEKDFRQQIIDIIGLDLGDGIDKLIALFKEWHNKLSVPIEVDRGVEKAAEEIFPYADEPADKNDIAFVANWNNQIDLKREGFIAGAKLAANDAAYWKQRCEAAELWALAQEEEMFNAYEYKIKWQSLKQKQL